jgi:hypothetical protein
MARVKSTACFVGVAAGFDDEGRDSKGSVEKSEYA